jgi:carboxylesterase type B
MSFTSYRLNIFGFPKSPALEKQNLGIRDQRVALEWLRDNIAEFGGDPEHIVLGGQSSGADTGSAMVYSHAGDPIVVGLAFQSGSVQIINAETEEVDSEFVRVAGIVGCADNSNRSQDAVSNKTFNLFGDPARGSPMVDNVTIFTLDEYTRRGTKGQFEAR